MKLSKLNLIKFILYSILVLSTVALIYHVRWLASYMANSIEIHVPDGQTPYAWFSTQIASNLIFIYVGYLLLRLFARYQKAGYFEVGSLQIFNSVIVSLLGLAILSIVRLAFSDSFFVLPLSEYNSLAGIINLIFVLFVDTVTFKEPQTMYFLLVLILWSMKQFVVKALSIKQENEAFI